MIIQDPIYNHPKIQEAYILYLLTAVHTIMCLNCLKNYERQPVSGAALSNKTFCNNGEVLVYAIFVLLSI